MTKHSVKTILKSKNIQKLSMITAYDYLFAKLFDSEVDMILVGDSLNMSFGGKKDTLDASLDIMIYHTRAVCNGAPNSFVICDMPFGTYTDEIVGLNSAIRVYQETNADAIKIEGGAEKAHIIKKITQNGIAVVGHIGLLPQFFRSEGYSVKGKEEKELQKLINDAKAVEEAGAFLLVIEGVKAQTAKEITKAVNIPTIGIGAGKDTDGQVLVWSDMLGFFEDFKPKFVREYLHGAQLVKNAIRNYNDDVKSGKFPTEKESY
ncbi:MAG: 3-methyl-2-oxobutanoate hydroxymethyltransferase [Campylobacterota bacterium]|nr:3-methyl-2-oxobutanoate hydroxymethyltransferase [Campylobacterota bacterium]